MRLTLSLLLLFFVVTANAIDLKPSLLMDVGMPKIEPASSSVTYGNRGSMGLGALLGMQFLSLELETGLLIAPYGYKAEVASLSTTAEIRWWTLEIPILFRYHFLGLLSVGAGGYFSFAMGKAKTTTTVSTVSAETEAELEDAAKSDYGLAFALGASIPIGTSTSVIADLRYLLGLKNLTATSGATIKLNHLQILGGLSFGL